MGPPIHCREKFGHRGRQVVSLTKRNILFWCGPALVTLGVDLSEPNTRVSTKTCMSTSTAAYSGSLYQKAGVDHDVLQQDPQTE